LVRFFVDCRIKPHVPPLEQIPANSVKFLFCNSTIQVNILALAIKCHILRYKLLGYLILFDFYTLIFKNNNNFIEKINKFLKIYKKFLHFIAIFYYLSI